MHTNDTMSAMPIAKMHRWLALGVVVGLSVACGGGILGDPARKVERYLQARVEGDVNRMIALSCAAWEANARLEATSIQGRSPALEGLRCQASEPQGDTVFVACAGKIVTSYDGERREFDLAGRQFRLVAEAGEWRMCGYR
jgi:hypothetical protein